MTQQISPQIYNIPAGQPFARTIIRALLDDYTGAPDALSAALVLLPTRRACRGFQEIFLQETGGRPLLLPKIQPIGDIDEQDLSLSLAGTEALDEILALPPAISPLRRRILLAKTIHAMGDFTSGFDQALSLADALAAFLDQIIIEQCDFSALATIVPEEFAGHWQITLDFLGILGAAWPAILAEEGVIDGADRRNRLMHILAHHWQTTRPQTRIIAAGSTGSMPATAELLRVIAHLPHGCVILPGLDQTMDSQSWSAITPSHPQYGLKQLLGHIGAKKDQVQIWRKIADTENNATARIQLASEMMRPSETAREWTRLYSATASKNNLHNALQGLSLIETANQREEAAMIALSFRQILETGHATATLITPDRKLARRVSGFCKRWGIEVDDSAGQSLRAAPLGTYLLLLCEAAIAGARPAALLALLKHKLSAAGLEKNAYYRHLYALERHLLRGLKPQAGWEGLRARFESLTADPDHRPAPPPHILEFVKGLETILQPFFDLMHGGKTVKFITFLRAHLQVAEALASTHITTGAARLWQGEAGEAATLFLSELAQQADSFDDLDGAAYLRIINQLLGDVPVRPKYGTHPRLSILGQLEARLIDADFLILGGLNEGSWPPDPGHDPWMSRPMRARFGLPDQERAVGLAAHDFVQGFCNRRVLLTRAKTVDGAATVPARWLQRLDTVLQSAGLRTSALHDHALRHWYAALDDHGQTTPTERPKPCPPAARRPQRLSVTRIETLMKDPYAIYASHILGLRALEPVEKPLEAKEKGNLVHDVMERFIRHYPDTIPPDARDILRGFAQDHIAGLHEDESTWSFWWPRFQRLADWFLTQEAQWRKEHRARPLALEAKGVHTLQTANGASLTLSGIADRIDLLADGRCAIIDYKTSSAFSAAKMASGDTPQLTLEGIMLEAGAFADSNVAAGKTAGVLAYWSLTGGSQAGKVTALPSSRQSDLPEILERTQAGLERLIDTFADPATPYICLPRTQAAPRFNDYAHLERISEWAALEDDDGETEAA